MTVAQAQAFLAAARGTPLEAMWAVMLYLGLRPGEAAALAWADIDVDNNIVHVRLGRKRTKGTTTIGTTRTPGSVRSLTAPTKVVNLLQQRRLEQRLQVAVTWDAWNNEHDLVFTNKVRHSCS